MDMTASLGLKGSEDSASSAPSVKVHLLYESVLYQLTIPLCTLLTLLALPLCPNGEICREGWGDTQ